MIKKKKQLIECKDCRYCDPNLVAGYKYPNDRVYPSDYWCILSSESFPTSADQCPSFISDFGLPYCQTAR